VKLTETLVILPGKDLDTMLKRAYAMGKERPKETDDNRHSIKQWEEWRQRAVWDLYDDFKDSISRYEFKLDFGNKENS